ncbi:MAG: hypothetical protein KKF62_18515 [Bacteroidetes bacterium]|nr:hypothetical protein [Bacteroidota bacterium]MBU1114378.1 hypothetical protein [Bacteroidota bacterium]MBU1798327.1 hypothetical protein [Bacteroidota bacterium]
MRKKIKYKIQKSKVFILLPVAVPYGNESQRDADKRLRKSIHIISGQVDKTNYF